MHINLHAHVPIVGFHCNDDLVDKQMDVYLSEIIASYKLQQDEVPLLLHCVFLLRSQILSSGWSCEWTDLLPWSHSALS